MVLVIKAEQDLGIFRPYIADCINQKDTPHRDRGKSYYIGRGSVSSYGNPYHVQQYGRTRSILLYLAMVMEMDRNERITWLRPIAENLRHGRKLRCYCAPLDCHGMVLAGLARFYYNLGEPTPSTAHEQG